MEVHQQVTRALCYMSIILKLGQTVVKLCWRIYKHFVLSVISGKVIWSNSVGIMGTRDLIRLTDKQKKELDRRLASYEKDLSVGSSWKEARKRILSSLREPGKCGIFKS